MPSINKPSRLGKKIIVTGIYGSGKTTIVDKIKRNLSYYDICSFDEIIGYDESRSIEDWKARDLALYNKLENDSYLIMDALPLYTIRKDIFDSISGLKCGTTDYLESFANRHDCTFILVMCEFNHWINERVPLKSEDALSLVNSKSWNSSSDYWNACKSEYEYFYKTYSYYFTTKFPTKTIFLTSDQSSEITMSLEF